MKITCTNLSHDLVVMYQKMDYWDIKNKYIPTWDVLKSYQQKLQHDKIVKKAESIETIQQSLTTAKNQNQAEQLQNRLQAEEHRLDYTVY